MTLEEARKRTEASLARKRNMAALSSGTNATTEAPQSPVTSGAMDSLLEKLRAAAPQARDQRDRRRRARLKERHNDRVASGQHIPETHEDGEGADAHDAETNASTANDDNSNTTETGLLSPPGQETDAGAEGQTTESGDVADRAASMLQGLRDNTDDGERSRRRRESAEDERRKRRMRRRNGPTSGSKDSGDGSGLSSIKEPMSPPADSTTDSMTEAAEVDERPPSTPTIVVSPDQQHDHDQTPDGSPRSKADSEPSD